MIDGLLLDRPSKRSPQCETGVRLTRSNRAVLTLYGSRRLSSLYGYLGVAAQQSEGQILRCWAMALCVRPVRPAAFIDMTNASLNLISLTILELVLLLTALKSRRGTRSILQVGHIKCGLRRVLLECGALTGLC